MERYGVRVVTGFSHRQGSHAYFHWRCDCGATGTGTRGNLKKHNSACPACRQGASGPLEDRFWRFVKKTRKCWLWTGATHEFGYGLLGKPGRSGNLRAHRVSWELHFGKIPKGRFVLHHCDNPGCVRPNHLFLGTHADNMRDMKQKGRAGQRGEKHTRTKLTAQDVRTIRRRIAAGEMQRTLAAEYGISETTVSGIKHRGVWSHI